MISAFYKKAIYVPTRFPKKRLFGEIIVRNYAIDFTAIM